MTPFPPRSCVLNELGVDSDQLICLAILVGTDFNNGGVKGIGPKKALTLVREKKYPIEIFRELEEQGRLNFNWREIFEIFKKPNVKNIDLTFPEFNTNKFKEILVNRHEFSLDRVEKQIEKFIELKKQGAQKKLF